jgi:hypothetical protein
LTCPSFTAEMNCEYDMVESTDFREPKLLKTDIKTTAMTTHRIMFFNMSFTV